LLSRLGLGASVMTPHVTVQWKHDRERRLVSLVPFDCSLKDLNAQAQRVSSPPLFDADFGCVGGLEPDSWHGNCFQVPSAVSLQEDEAGASLDFCWLEFLARVGAASVSRAAIKPTKIACRNRMGSSPFLKWLSFS